MALLQRTEKNEEEDIRILSPAADGAGASGKPRLNCKTLNCKTDCGKRV